MFQLSRIILLISTLLFGQTCLASAFQLYELGTPVIGTAGVGQAAIAEDASTSYFNPAGMGLLDCNQFMIGSQILVPYTNFSKKLPSNTIPGDNGGNAGSLTPGLDLYFVYRASPKLRLGISMTTPYGGMLNYDNGWVGRYIVQNVGFYTININPGIGYRVNDYLSLGAGFSLEYINLQETVALHLIPLIDIDGQIKVSLANIAPGFNLGLMFTPSPNTRIGIAYRSQINHHLRGNATFLRIVDEPHTSTTMIMPHNVILSFVQNFSRFTVLGEVGWANWSSMHNSILKIDNYSVVTPDDWSNTWRAGLGGQFHINPCLLLEAGASWDSSPTSSSHRLPDLPMDRQVRMSAGLMYKIFQPVTLGASYEYINFGPANINNSSTVGDLVGHYKRNYANTFQISLNVAT